MCSCVYQNGDLIIPAGLHPVVRAEICYFSQRYKLRKHIVSFESTVLKEIPVPRAT